MANDWCVYMIRADDGSLYTGVTTDLKRRFEQHRTGRGAKYFRGRVPLAVVFEESGHTRSTAATREYQIKQLGRSAKLDLARGAGEEHDSAAK